MAKKKKKEESAHAGAPAWMTTYGDMMTLLLCFFVLLVSMSTMEIEKFKQATASLKGALSVLPYQDKVRPQIYQQRQQPAMSREKVRDRQRARALENLKRVIRRNNMTRYITVSEGSEGIHIVVGDPALFDSGMSNVKTAFNPILDGIIEVFKAGTGEEALRVEGHTDNVPINTPQFEDNWELSIARALSVIRYIREMEDIDPRRLRPVGGGEYHPVATNDTPEGRALNRRVEIFIELDNPERAGSDVGAGPEA